MGHLIGFIPLGTLLNNCLLTPSPARQVGFERAVLVRGGLDLWFRVYGIGRKAQGLGFRMFDSTVLQ